jgi:hypothetical protein
MDVSIKENLVIIPIGLKIGLIKICKTGSKSIVRMINGFNKNQFFSIFDEEDVDFQLIIDNQLCVRGIRFTLCINNNNNPYYIRPGKLSAMETLETNGRKFHFKSQNTDEGQLIVAVTADKHEISYSEAAINCSKITFHIDVEKLIQKLPQELINSFDELKINVFVQTLTGKTIEVDIRTDNTVFDLKRRIAHKEGISISQTLIFNSKQLEDDKYLREYDIINNSVLFVIYNPGFNTSTNNESFNNKIRAKQEPNGSPFTCLKTGLKYGNYFFDAELNMKSDSMAFLRSNTHNCNSEPKCLSSSSFSSRVSKQNGYFQNNNRISESNTTLFGSQTEQKIFSGERGVICCGDQSEQKFTEYDGFEQDYSLLINSFTIEMRMGSKYTPI